MKNKFYTVKVNAEINVDIDATSYDCAINEAQHEVVKTLKCLFGDDEVKINSIIVTGAD